MLTEKQCLIIEKALTEDVEPRKVAAYLCLHMGLPVNEVAALKLSDIDFKDRTIHIVRTIARNAANGEVTYELSPTDYPRELQIPSFVFDYLQANHDLYESGDCYIISGQDIPNGTHLLQNVLVSINNKFKIADNLTAIRLRQAFIRRSLMAGIDLFTVSYYTGVRQVGEIQKKYAEFLTPRADAIEVLERFTVEPNENDSEPDTGKRMNFLILGAGSQGHVVKEIAEALNVFNKIDFLDDNRDIPDVMDSCNNYKKYLQNYPIALPSFGNCELREKWMERLEKVGFIIPTLIHPMATVSPSAKLGAGTTVEVKCTIGPGAQVGKGCIISTGAIIEPSASVDRYCHIDSSATVKKEACVKPLTKIESGTVVEPEDK